MSKFTKKWAEELLASADIKINGGRDWDIRIHNEKFFDRVAGQGSLGLGEAYMDGWWDAASLDQFFYKIFASRLEERAGFFWNSAMMFLRTFFINHQSANRAFEVGEKHYDIGNDLYEAMLDKRLTYTCGYWRGAKNLNDAQEKKLDLVCRKLGLAPDQKVLDIGCGWGSFAKYAAEKYGANITGITVSREQIALGQKLCHGLAVNLRYEDYRDTGDCFDHIVSLGMFEHVGVKNYRAYMEKCHSLLKDGGLFLLHTIGSNVSTRAIDSWIDKYIFPNSMLPSITQIGKAIEGLFVMEDWHNFSADYDKTLMAWFANFEAAWPDLRKNYSDRFYRMWKYYLLSCAAGFRARNTQLWQIVLSKRGVEGGYASLR